MDKSEFCEKLFETLVNAELLNKTGLSIYVPSQVRESKLGIDALFQTKKHRKVLLLQYKIVEEYKYAPIGMTKPSFRFSLHNHKKYGYKQHNLLVKKYKKGLNCGYCVPTFIKYKDLYSLYNKGDLLSSCFLIESSYPISDKKTHYINFDNSNAFQHSVESLKCKMSNIYAILQECNEYSKEKLIEMMCDKDNDSIDSVLKETNSFLVLL